MKHKTYFAYLVLATLLTGCLKVKSKDEAAKATLKTKTQVAQPQAVIETPITNELLIEEVNFNTVGQNQPNAYSINFYWLKAKSHLRISSGGKVLNVLDAKTTQEWNLINLRGGSTYSILIEILDDQDHIAGSKTLEIEIPEDRNLTKVVRLAGDMKITNGRVFMDEATIITGSFKLEIYTKQLIVLKKSVIQNYLPDAKAKVGTAGRDGGSVFIQADKAQGELEITMNSEAGGDGFKGYESPACELNAGLGCMLTQVHCEVGGYGYPAGRNGDLIVKVKEAVEFDLTTPDQFSFGGEKGPSMNENAPADYPVISTRYDGTPDTCVRGGVQPNGADATPGKKCLMLASPVPQPGCE
ncbi:hypothetical protein CIK05_02715 [Bdellovibrio sp. qaytius]|nr:hypothetical protein CIK05_02715 [Bdellovibrio sp. qaytius]